MIVEVQPETFIVLEVARPIGGEAEDVEFGTAHGPFHDRPAAESFTVAMRTAADKLEADYHAARKIWWQRRHEVFGNRGLIAGTEGYAPLYEIAAEEYASIGPQPEYPELWDYEVVPLMAPGIAYKPLLGV